MLSHQFEDKYLYLKVDCKTPNCNTACVLKFLGPYFGQGKISHLIPEWFEYDGERHHRNEYVRSDVVPIVLDFPPPPEYRDAF